VVTETGEVEGVSEVRNLQFDAYKYTEIQIAATSGSLVVNNGIFNSVESYLIDFKVGQTAFSRVDPSSFLKVKIAGSLDKMVQVRRKMSAGFFLAELGGLAIVIYALFTPATTWFAKLKMRIEVTTAAFTFSDKVKDPMTG